MIIISFSIYIIQDRGRIKEYPNILQEVELDGSYEVRDESGVICSVKAVDRYCIIGDSEKSENLFIIGDSVATSLAPPYVENHEKFNLRVHLLTRESCYFAPAANRSQINPHLPCDENYQIERLKILSNNEPGIIVISGMLDYYITNRFYVSSNKNTWVQNFTEEIKNLIDQGFKIVFFYPQPGTSCHLGKTAINFWNAEGRVQHFYDGLLPDKIVTKINDICTVQEKDFDRYSNNAFSLLDNIISPHIIRIYPHKLICDGECKFALNGQLFYIDKTHYSKSTREQLFEEAIEKIMDKGWLIN